MGGIEFYNKMLERNMALRSLMGLDGKKYYTPSGNAIRKRTLETVVHLTERRKNLIAHFEKYVEQAKAKAKDSEELQDSGAQI